MRKSCFFVFLAFLFVISCSNGDDPLIPCITVADCPDTSYSCFDGFCVHAGAVVDPTDSDNDSSSGNTVPDDGQNDDENSSDGNNNNNDGDSERPDSVNDNENSEPSSDDKDNEETSDSDGAESGDSSETSDDTEENDGENNDGNSGENDADSNNEENDNSSENNDGDADSDSNDSENPDVDADSGNSGDTDNDADADVDADTDTGTELELPTEPAACAAAIAALPNGGKYDWDDATTQGFSTNNYWNLVESSVLAARSGNYSFGKYSQYTVNKDQISPLSTATDLSQCAQCTVKASFYVKGKICNGNCEAQTFLHPTCNGEGNTTVVDKTVTTWSQWTIPPESPWVDDDLDFFKAKANNNQYSAVAWKDLEWTIPETCKTDQFVFALRFRSSSLVAGPGLVVDDLTIYTTTQNEPKGEFESAENGEITGWACDPDAYSEKVPVKVRYYKNKNESVVAAERSVDAESERTDLTQCNGTYNHGFEIPFDDELAAVLGIGTHSAAVFAGDLPAECAGNYKLIGKKEFQITSLNPKQQ
ncbi:hypothetical protein II898_03625 [bacterium]|nr:hypothetical protein [bacterium]